MDQRTDHPHDLQGLRNAEEFDSNAGVDNGVYMNHHHHEDGTEFVEEYEEEYIQLADGRLVPTSEVQLGELDEHTEIAEGQEHFITEEPTVSHTSHVQSQSQGGPAVFAIRGSQMYRVEKVCPSDQLQTPAPTYKYVDNTMVTVKKEDSGAGMHRGTPGPNTIYHVQQPSSSSARPFVPYGDTFGEHRPKMEFNAYVNPNIRINQRAPKAKRRTAAGQRKPCNCTKSQCLKLYCDCFANGEFCLDCNCKDCHNNIEHESDRTRAIKQSLERNPNAFKPKIGVTKAGQTDIERLHQKGCHCKKSGCLKNYCECFEAKVPCTDRCKCKGCQNTEHDRASRYKDKATTSALMNLANAATASVSSASSRPDSPISDDESDPENGRDVDPRTFPWFYMTDEVIEAATLCMVAQSEELLSRAKPDENVVEPMECLILREFGRCMEQIITSASNASQ